MSEPRVCEPEVDRAALFFEFCVALDQRLQRWEAGKKEYLEEDCGWTHTHTL